MKELSIEEKAKRYDEALAMAKECITYIPDEAVNKYMLDMFPELKESEGEMIRKAILEHIQLCSESIPDRDRWIAWLEKQGEQKPVDKVEPKFHEGDFIKNNKANLICKVISVNSGSYCVKNIETSSGIELFNAEQNFHLWTIEDARDGDVLAGKIDGDSYILIYKQIKDGWIETYGHYYDSVDRFCVPSQLFCREVKGTFRPTTKEQKEFLFQKMRKAGYEWNEDKKELIKL